MCIYMCVEVVLIKCISVALGPSNKNSWLRPWKNWCFDKKSNAFLITQAAIHNGFSFFMILSHAAASTSPTLLRIVRLIPTEADFFDWEIATLSLWIQSDLGGFHFAAINLRSCEFFYCTSTNSNLCKSARDHNSWWEGAMLLKTTLVLHFQIIQQAIQRECQRLVQINS